MQTERVFFGRSGRSSPLVPEVATAQARLAEALHRLDALQRAALLGGHYDADEYDAAVIAYRHARAEFDDACNETARLAHAS